MLGLQGLGACGSEGIAGVGVAVFRSKCVGALDSAV